MAYVNPKTFNYNKIHHSFKGSIFRTAVARDGASKQPIFMVERFDRSFSRDGKWIPVGIEGSEVKFYDEESALEFVDKLHKWAIYVPPIDGFYSEWRRK